MLKSLLLLFLIIALCNITVDAQATPELRIGWVMHEAGSEYQEEEVRILAGLDYWQKKMNDQKNYRKEFTVGGNPITSVQVINITASTNNNSFAAAYQSLIAQGVNALIGPWTLAATLDALQGVQGSNLPFASLVSNDAVFSAYPLAASILADDSLLSKPTTHINALTELLDKKAEAWVILTRPNNTNNEDWSKAWVVANNTRFELESGDNEKGYFYTIQYYGEFATWEEYEAHLDYIKSIRPRPDALMISTPLWSIGDFENFTEPIIALDVNPGSIVTSFPLGVDDNIFKNYSKKLEYYIGTTWWAKGFDYHGKPFGSANEFSKKFEEEHGDKSEGGGPPGPFEALGVATPLFLQYWFSSTTASPPTTLPNMTHETFFGIFNFSESGINQGAQFEASQIQGGKSIGIGDHAEIHNPSYPGRWSWITYHLESGAIIGIVVASILVTVGLIIGGWAIWKFVHIFLDDPEEEEGEDDEDKKDGEGKQLLDEK